jgi:hypothetical protein
MGRFSDTFPEEGDYIICIILQPVATWNPAGLSLSTQIRYIKMPPINKIGHYTAKELPAGIAAVKQDER